MSCNRENNLIIIENGQISTFRLDDRTEWSIGRVNAVNMPDIRLHSPTVSRLHGRFRNMDGIWFYCDDQNKNGTVLNGHRIESGIGKRKKPYPLEDGDVLIFGGAERYLPNSRSVWTMFSEYLYDDNWRVEDTKGMEKISFSDRDDEDCSILCAGTVIRKDQGIAIYMGDITYLAGKISLYMR